MILIRYIWYYSFWLLVKIGLGYYFKRIKVSGIENIPKNAPVIFGANHENAFIDALLITTRTTRFTHYLVRADVFKNAFVRGIFKSFNMLPVYRIRDGFKSLKSNSTIFEACHKALAKGLSLILFPEGNHDIRRVPRKLTKGISRIALGTMNADNPPKELYVIPVGLNYTDHKSFRSSVHIIYGKAIKIDLNNPETNTNETLRKTINTELLNRTLGLREEYYEQLDTLIFKTESGYQLSNTEPINSKALKYIDHFESNNNDGLFNAIDEFDESLEDLGTKNWLSISATSKVNLLTKLIFLCPFYLYGLIQNLIPILIIESIIGLKVKEKIFSASIKFSIGLFLFPLYWFLQSLLLWDYSTPFYLDIAYWFSLPISLLIVNIFHATFIQYLAKKKLDNNEELRNSIEGSLEYINKFKSRFI
ncbi:MAG: 1-acyl-sn-glycerol-3-phosphate acyltransferase [Cyclobacteriaceae bacterium]|jgi:1-acyl-sn-glycerol-3-phosphate acyltransferase